MVFIVIPHFIIDDKLVKLATDTIKSFKDTCECTIINCDDASPYDSTFLKDISDVYIRNEKNLGFAGNCNVGFQWILDNVKEDCDIVCVNNDIEVYKGWYEEFKKVQGIVGGRIIGGLGFRTKGNPPDKSTYNGCSVGGYFDDWMFPGGFYMIKRSVLVDYGLYDDNFKHGGYEDIDIFLRWHNAGEKLVIAPRVAYWHQEGATRFSEREKGIQDIHEKPNREYYCKKNNRKLNDNLLDFMKDIKINF